MYMMSVMMFMIKFRPRSVQVRPERGRPLCHALRYGPSFITGLLRYSSILRCDDRRPLRCDISLEESDADLKNSAL
jgi:hypothetical protein